MIAKEFKEDIYLMENGSSGALILDNEVIVNEEKINAIFVNAADKIYDKYIAFSAALCINISSARKKEFRQVFVERTIPKSIDRIMPILEHTVIELSSLLNDSRFRFGRYKEYTEVALEMVKSSSHTELDVDLSQQTP